jgi:chromosome segregation ATPase
MSEAVATAGGGVEGVDDFTTTEIEQLESDFQEVLAGLVGDKSLEKFREEYEKLHHALQKSHENEKRLVKKIKELNQELMANAARVATALQMSEDDDTTIENLKKQIERAWAMVEAAHEKETKADETIRKLNDEIRRLTELVQEHGDALGGDETVDELLRVRDVLQRKNEEAQDQIRSLNETVDELHARVEHKRQKNRQKKAAIQDLKDGVRQKEAEAVRETKKRERLDKELRELRVELESKSKEASSASGKQEEAEARIGKLEGQLKEARKTMEKYLRDFDALYQNTQKLTEQLDEQMHRNDLLTEQNIGLEAEMKRRDIELNKARSESTRMERKFESEVKRAQRLKDKGEEERTKQQELKAEIRSLTNELDGESKKLGEAKKSIAVLERERGMEQRKRMKEGDKAKEHMEKFEASERAIQHLENKITRYRNEAIKARNVIYQLEKDREKYGVQASDAQAKLMTAHEEMKLRENQIGELEKKETDLRGRLKHQQQMYEAVRADRNLYSKHLIEAQDEIAEMRRKFKIMNHQIEQLKEEITAKDRALVAEHFEHQSVEKRLDQSTHEIERLRKQLSDSQQAIGKQDAEIAELNTTIRRMDADMLRQKKEYDQMTTERDILGTQLIRRNDELALLYEKVKIQQSTLRKGEAQYQNRMQDIRMLKLKIGDLRRELHIAKRQAGRLGDVKREVYRLQRELLQEKTKVKALSEELENPMNVHRWRKLEGSDPATYEMIQKIQTLQKRLISKTEEVVEKELLI